jgi:site-specific recombinase XerD
MASYAFWASVGAALNVSRNTKAVSSAPQGWRSPRKAKVHHGVTELGQEMSAVLDRLIPLRAFFKWLARENHILSNPASELELPRVHRKLPTHILSAEDVEAVMAQTQVHGEMGVRDRAILETLYSTGIRRSELINLKLYDIDLKNGSLLVRQGKGSKDRYVPLGSRAIQWLKRYLEDIRPSIVIEPAEGLSSSMSSASRSAKTDSRT